MAAREIIVKKYVVWLSGEEREQLAALTRKGRGLRIPMKSAMHSNMMSATCSDLKSATIPK